MNSREVITLGKKWEINRINTFQPTLLTKYDFTSLFIEIDISMSVSLSIITPICTSVLQRPQINLQISFPSE